MKLKILLLKFQMLPNQKLFRFYFSIKFNYNYVTVRICFENFIFQSAEIGVTLHFPTNDSLFCIIYSVQEVKVFPTCLVYNVFHGFGKV
jgi:hypothetical protein